MTFYIELEPGCVLPSRKEFCAKKGADCALYSDCDSENEDDEDDDAHAPFEAHLLQGGDMSFEVHVKDILKHMRKLLKEPETADSQLLLRSWVVELALLHMSTGIPGSKTLEANMMGLAAYEIDMQTNSRTDKSVISRWAQHLLA